MKNIVILGSTGSVGASVIHVVREFPDKFNIIGIASNRNVEGLIKQAEEFSPGFVAINDELFYGELKEKISGNVNVLSGPSSLDQLASLKEADIVVLAISGTAALKPLFAALESGKVVALASKEPIVSAGEEVRKVLKDSGGCILPVDSEHSAIFQCLEGKDTSSVESLYITGSGGPLYGKTLEDLEHVTMEEVLDHPKWDMGKKITVDSATLMNKGLEMIEARWLFDVASDKIKVVIHPEAIIHSMVEFVDGTVLASMFTPDMRFPVLKALSYPEVLESSFPRVDFDMIGSLTFKKVDHSRFPALQIAYDTVRSGGTMPAVLNAANEAAVKLFLNGKLPFSRIIRMIEEVLSKHKKKENPSLDEIIDTERWAHEEVLRSC